MADTDAVDPREVAERGLQLSGMDYIRAASTADSRVDGLLRCLRGAWPCSLRDATGAAALQPDRLGARRRGADAPRLCDGVRRPHLARPGRRLHDARSEDQLRPP